MTDEHTELEVPETPETRVSLREYVDIRVGDLKELIAARFTAEARALQVAKAEIDRRLEQMNELREQIQQERGTYVTRELLDQQLSELKARMGRIEYGESRKAPGG